MGLFHNPTHIKKTAALRFVFDISYNFKLASMNTKPLRFRFSSAVCSFLQLFFLISLALGIDGVLRLKQWVI